MEWLDLYLESLMDTSQMKKSVDERRGEECEMVEETRCIPHVEKTPTKKEGALWLNT